MILTKFHVNWPFGSGEEVKNRFQDERFLAIFDLPVTLMRPSNFPVTFGLSVQEKKRNIDFQDGRHFRSGQF